MSANSEPTAPERLVRPPRRQVPAMTFRLMVAAALLLLWLDGGPGFESSAADAVRWGATAAGSTMQSIAELIYNAIDSHVEPTGDVRRYVAYWLAAAAAIVILATVANEALLHVLSSRWLQARDLVGSRYARGEKLAKAAAPDSHMPRSALNGYENESRLTRSQRRLRRRAIAKRGPTSEGALRLAARTQYLGERTLELANKPVRFFGGEWVERISDGRYGWSYRGGLCDPLPQGWASPRQPLRAGGRGAGCRAGRGTRDRGQVGARGTDTGCDEAYVEGVPLAPRARCACRVFSLDDPGCCPLTGEDRDVPRSPPALSTVARGRHDLGGSVP